MVKTKLDSKLSEKMDSPYFYDRLFACLTEDGVDIKYGDLYSKCKKNGTIKVVKSLGLYKVDGRGINKTAQIHPKLNLIINTTVADSEVVAKTIADLFKGKYIGVDKFDIGNLDCFMALPDNDIIISDSSFGTYIILNKDSGLYKIGKTKDLGKRLATLKKEFCENLFVIGFCTRDIESELHILYSKHREFGEWFSIDMDVALDICSSRGFAYVNHIEKYKQS